MELRELYELHDRLEAAAVAGVNLMEEDFRLKRGHRGGKTPVPGFTGNRKAVPDGSWCHIAGV